MPGTRRVHRLRQAARVAIGGNDIPKGALVEIDAIAVL